MSSVLESHQGRAHPPQKWTLRHRREARLEDRLLTAIFAQSLDNPQHENKNRTCRAANQFIHFSVAARQSWHADACENGAVISPVRQSCLSIANKVYAAAKKRLECRYG